MIRARHVGSRDFVIRRLAQRSSGNAETNLIGEGADTPRRGAPLVLGSKGRRQRRERTGTARSPMQEAGESARRKGRSATMLAFARLEG
jgi:hypothetical protein